jgi:hypothetical protein
MEGCEITEYCPFLEMSPCSRILERSLFHQLTQRRPYRLLLPYKRPAPGVASIHKAALPPAKRSSLH